KHEMWKAFAKAPTSKRQRPVKVGFYLYWTLAYDLEGLTPGTRQHEMWKAFAQPRQAKDKGR
ncbi:hypothetical protein ACFVR2_12730, partial [Gottfriedia sp. NPDC057991]|uniref:hypothetical protein n=1 Tax=Gottfriedia sp. NPDC057991 TaxID=3346298 RepID=UPI0036D76F47